MSLRWVSFAELTTVLGQDLATILCRELGGLCPYLPRKPKPKHKIVKLLGQEAADKLATYCGGNHLDIPNKRRQAPSKEKIWEMLDDGQTHEQIATECIVSTRWVRAVAKDRRWAQKQMRLPM